jgi:hypothetical protein
LALERKLKSERPKISGCSFSQPVPQQAHWQRAHWRQAKTLQAA